MSLVEKNDIKQIFADQAPSIDKPASFANYPRGWDTARPNNGKPTIKQFNYLQQRTDQNILWMHQNGAALPYDATMEYAEGAVVVKDGKLQQKQGDSWVNVGVSTAAELMDESGQNQQELNNTQKLKTQYVTIQMFDGASDHEKFLNAIASNKNILVTAGDYTINNNNINKILTHKNGQFIHFEDGARIFFNYNGFPLFNCVNSNGGGLTGFAEFVFTGVSQITSDFTMTQYKAACGVANIVGGPHELHTVIMRVNCNNHKIADHFKFRSQIDSRANGIIFCINDKGNGTTQTKGNIIGDCTFENCIHGLLAASQRNFKYGNFYSNKRWSHPNIPPGHVVYLTGAAENGWLNDGFMGDICDLGNTLDQDVEFNLAPLAPKGCTNVQFGRLVSHHFSGLYQSITSCNNCTFGKAIWRYTGTVENTSPHVNIAGGSCKDIYLDIDADCPNVVFKFYEDSIASLDNSIVKLKVRCKQQPPADVASNSQMVRSSSNGTIYEIDWTPSTGVGAFYVMPFEEIAGIASTSRNVIKLSLHGANLVASSTRVITRTQSSVQIISEKSINRDITFQPYADFAKRTFNTNVYKYNKAGVSVTGEWEEVFQIPAEGVFILSLSAYVSGGNGHTSAWLLNYTPSIGVRVANQIGVNQDTPNPKVALTSIVVDAVGLVTLTFNKTTSDASTLNVNLTKIGTLY